MTAKKDNPSKRGRKHLARGAYETVLLRYRSFYRDEKTRDPQRLRRDIGDDFVAAHLGWFASIGVAIGNYATLRNAIVKGRKERAARRRQNWGITTNLASQKFITTNAAYIRHVQRGGRGLA